MRKFYKIIFYTTIIALTTMLVSNAETNYTAFDDIMEQIEVTRDYYTVEKKETVRSEILDMRMISQPGGEQAINQMMTLEETDSSSGNGSGSMFSGAMPTADSLTGDMKAKWGAKVAGTDKWNELILKVSQEKGINPIFVKCIMAKESGGDENALNDRNVDGTIDYGLMQVNSSWGNRFEYDRIMTDPEYAIACGIDVIKEKIAMATSNGEVPTAFNIFWYYNGHVEQGRLYAEDAVLLYEALSGGTRDDDISIFVSLGNLKGYPEELRSRTEFSRNDLIAMATSLLDVKQDVEGNQPVPYFWGGRSTAYGFDGSWFETRRVTAGGSQTSGQMRIYGLDCSGFIAWTYGQLPEGQKSGLSGVLTSNAQGQYNSSIERNLSIDELKPGDLGFTPNFDHVGMYIGKDPANGMPMFIHEGGSGADVDYVGGVFQNGFVYERGCVRISYLGSSNPYPSEISGVAVTNWGQNFTHFSRVMHFPED
ncbi:MAG TPA: hypothetical protein DCP90_00205 [Clostridiales bacterium]|nr:MAG: hypothetical protein A2Y22_04405 [Clostridiales bacterium GWD2_32_59]HAN09017.1 hypothetical protein [Clostridiales bacterium]